MFGWIACGLVLTYVALAVSDLGDVVGCVWWCLLFWVINSVGVGVCITFMCLWFGS